MIKKEGRNRMQFFSRCRIFVKISFGICILLGWTIMIKLIGLIGRGAFDSDKDLIIFLFFVLLFTLFLTITIVLKCIIKDGQEDLEAVTRYLQSHDSTMQ